MLELVILADDYTGALDSAVQFAKKGYPTTAYTAPPTSLQNLEDIQVVAISTNSRHLSSENAYAILAHVAAVVQQRGIPFLLKKTDSALRGNIGSELQAVLDATGQNSLYFLPAFPKNGRTTADGIQYIDGVPVAQSVFGQDPFTPVLHSDVARIIAKQSAIATQRIEAPAYTCASDGKPCIYLADAVADQDIQNFCTMLQKECIPASPLLLAGCAGLAEYLPQILSGVQARSVRSLDTPTSALLVSGSLNPITQAQLAYAKAQGIAYFPLSAACELAPDFLQSEAGNTFVSEVQHVLSAQKRVIIETDGIALEGTFKDLREQTCARIADLTQAILEGLRGYALTVFGGDTSTEILSCMFGGAANPLREIQPGIVLSDCRDQGGVPHYLVTKSGGFGGKDAACCIFDTLLP